MTHEFKVELGIPKGESQIIYLQYLDRELMTILRGGVSSYSLKEDGTANILWTPKCLQDHPETLVSWNFHYLRDGSLDHVSVCLQEHHGEIADGWQSRISDLLNKAGFAAFKQTRTRYFRRKICFYVGAAFAGEYWFGNLRIAPIVQTKAGDEGAADMLSERVLAMDFEVDAIDNMDAIFLAEAKFIKYAARFSLLLDLDIYKSPTRRVWVRGEDGLERCLHRGYFSYPHGDKMPKKGELCALAPKLAHPISEQGHHETDFVMFPAESRAILRAVDQLSAPQQGAFDGAARLYQISLALSSRFPSAALAYRVAAVDALKDAAGIEHFSEFMRRYSSTAQELPNLTGYLHSNVRSAHFHAGKFALNEFDYDATPGTLMPSTDIQAMQDRIRGFDATREAIVGWMLEQCGRSADAQEAARPMVQ